MIARLWFPDVIPLSKQHSRGMRYGRTYRLKSYTEARDALAKEAKVLLYNQGWRQPIECRVALRVSYRGRFDVDNAGGFVQDALQGAAYVRDSQVVLATYRKRLKGPNGIKIIIHTIKLREQNVPLDK